MPTSSLSGNFFFLVKSLLTNSPGKLCCHKDSWKACELPQQLTGKEARNPGEESSPGFPFAVEFDMLASSIILMIFF